MTDDLSIVQAHPDDLATIISIVEEAAHWLHRRGITGQWPLTFPPEYLAPHVAKGDYYLVLLGDQPVGTCMLLWADPEVWGDVPNDAGYVHGLAIRRSVGGRGVGRAMLRWAEQTAAAAGKRYLRLDCWGENHELRRYYERAGFASRGVIDTGGGWMCALFEKEL